VRGKKRTTGEHCAGHPIPSFVKGLEKEKKEKGGFQAASALSNFFRPKEAAGGRHVYISKRGGGERGKDRGEDMGHPCLYY